MELFSGNNDKLLVKVTKYSKEKCFKIINSHKPQPNTKQPVNIKNTTYPQSSKVKADFDYSGTLETGKDIVFTDKSTGNPTKWKWDFNDGDSSNLKNPSHRFDTDTEYIVSLRVYGDSGTDVCTKKITIKKSASKPYTPPKPTTSTKPYTPPKPTTSTKPYTPPKPTAPTKPYTPPKPTTSTKPYTPPKPTTSTKPPYTPSNVSGTKKPLGTNITVPVGIVIEIIWIILSYNLLILYFESPWNIIWTVISSIVGALAIFLSFAWLSNEEDTNIKYANDSNRSWIAKNYMKVTISITIIGIPVVWYLLNSMPIIMVIAVLAWITLGQFIVCVIFTIISEDGSRTRNKKKQKSKTNSKIRLNKTAKAYICSCIAILLIFAVIMLFFSNHSPYYIFNNDGSQANDVITYPTDGSFYIITESGAVANTQIGTYPGSYGLEYPIYYEQTFGFENGGTIPLTLKNVDPRVTIAFEFTPDAGSTPWFTMINTNTPKINLVEYGSRYSYTMSTEEYIINEPGDYPLELSGDDISVKVTIYGKAI